MPTQDETLACHPDDDAAVPPPSVGELLCGAGATPEQWAKVRALGERLYGHVLRLIDCSKADFIGHLLDMELLRLGVHDEDGSLRSAMFVEALTKIGHDAAMCVDLIPSEITEVERIAAGYEDDCLMCRGELADAMRRQHATDGGDQGAGDEDDGDREWRMFQAQAARSWRAQNAQALGRLDLGPRSVLEPVPKPAPKPAPRLARTLGRKLR